MGKVTDHPARKVWQRRRFAARCADLLARAVRSLLWITLLLVYVLSLLLLLALSLIIASCLPLLLLSRSVL